VKWLQKIDIRRVADQFAAEDSASANIDQDVRPEAVTFEYRPPAAIDEDRKTLARSGRCSAL
jgi:hypothetical protein